MENRLPSSNDDVFLILKQLARTCIFLQVFSCIFYILCVLFSSDSKPLAVTCGFIAIFNSILPIIFAIRNKKASVLFSSIFILNFAPIWFLYLEAVLPGYDANTYSDAEMIMLTMLYTGIFQIAINFFYIVCNKNVINFSINNFKFLKTIRLQVQSYFILTVFCFIIPLIFFYYYYGSFDVLWMAITAGRSGGGATGLLMQESIGDTSAFALPVTWIWQIVPIFGSLTFVAAKKKKTFHALCGLLMAFIVIFNYFLGGSRGQFVMVAAPVIFYFFYYNWNKGFKFWITVIPLFALIIGIMELQVRFRGNLLDVISNPTKAAQEKGYSNATSFDVTNTQRDNNTYLLCLIVKGVPKYYPYEGFNNFFAILFNPIPRAIWKGKPVLQGAKDLAEQPRYIADGPLFMGTTSLTYSVIGEAYLAAGIFGILVHAFLYALVSLFFDGLVFYAKNKDPLTIGIFGVGFFISFWGYRSFFALITVIYPIGLLILLLKFINLFNKNEYNIHRTQ